VGKKGLDVSERACAAWSDWQLFRTHSIEVMTSLFLNMTRFITNVFLVSEPNPLPPFPSNNNRLRSPAKPLVSTG
jgi:hypothetical protein